MNKHEFWAAAVARNKMLEKRYWWGMGGILSVIIAPTAVLYVVEDAVSAQNRELLSYIFLGIIIAGLLGLHWLLRQLASRSTKKFGLFCLNCGMAFEGDSLTALGFTDMCSKCGARVFDGSNSAIEK